VNAQKEFRVELELGTWGATLGLLIQKGLRLGSYIDIGAADGHFGLMLWRAGLFRSMQVASIDANPVYEPTLRKIHAAIGGGYRICAVDEKPGTLQLRTSSHPYWGSAAPPDDPYWQTINGQLGETVTVPCRTLDSIVEEMQLPAPYALKLDIQGGEAGALRSGPRTLRQTAVVISEVITHNFPGVNAALEAAGFGLLDITDVQRTADHSLGWFYVAYLHRDYAGLRSHTHFGKEANQSVLEVQHQRRAALLASIDDMVSKIEAEKKRPG
jgi:FkbM family methyltransferase